MNSPLVIDPSDITGFCGAHTAGRSWNAWTPWTSDAHRRRKDFYAATATDSFRFPRKLPDDVMLDAFVRRVGDLSIWIRTALLF